MNSEIRASSALTATTSNAGSSDLTLQNPLFSVGHQESFTHILKQHVDTRGEQRPVAEPRQERPVQKNHPVRQDHRAKDRREDGNRLPERNDAASHGHTDRQLKEAGSTARDDRDAVADEAQAVAPDDAIAPTSASSADGTQPSPDAASEAARAVDDGEVAATQPATAVDTGQVTVDSTAQDAMSDEGTILSELALLQADAGEVPMSEEAATASEGDAVSDLALSESVDESAPLDQAETAPDVEQLLKDQTAVGAETLANAEDPAAVIVADTRNAGPVQTAATAMEKGVQQATQSTSTDNTAADTNGRVVQSAMADVKSVVDSLNGQDEQNSDTESGESLENWELGHEPTQAEKNAENRTEFAKSLAAASDRNSPMKDQLAALVSQFKGETTQQEKTETTRNTATSDIKATAFGRSLEQLSNTRTEGNKAASTGIQTPVNSREWSGELGQRLVMMVSSKLKSAEIHLNPKDLGPVEVRIRMHEDKAHVVFTSQVAQTRDALEQAVPRLREMLDQNGVALGNVDVQDHGAHQSHAQEQMAEGKRQRESGDGTESDDLAVNEVAPRRLLGLVDFYA